MIEQLGALDGGDQDIRTDAAHLLFDEARIADGELPIDPRAFSARLTRLLQRGIGRRSNVGGFGLAAISGTRRSGLQSRER